MIRGILATTAASLFVSFVYAGTISAQETPLPAADATLSARLRVSFTVGAQEGRDWEVFANIADVAFDSRENLYVFDRGNARVVAFDSAGRFLRFIGRRGNGPGEFILPQRMTVTRDDEVVISDPARRAFSVFATDGTFRRSVPFAQGTMMAGARLLRHPRGGVVSSFLQSFTGGLREQVAWHPLGNAAATPLFTGRTSTPGAPAQPVFSPSARFAVLPGGGLAVASTEAYSIHVLAPDGSTVRVLLRPIAPRRVTARDREHEHERRRALGRPGGVTIVGPGATSLPASARAPRRSPRRAPASLPSARPR